MSNILRQHLIKCTLEIKHLKMHYCLIQFIDLVFFFKF